MVSPGPQSDSLNIQLLVDSIPALIHTARPDGYLDYFNKPWLEYFGVTLEKVIGWNWTAFVHPEDVEGIVAKWRACLTTGEIFEYETRVRRANGEYRWMFHRKVPLRDACGNILKWYGSSLDIEDRKTAEEKIRAQQRELRDLLDSIPAVVWSALPDGSNSYVNSRWVEYSGLPTEQMAGSGWHTVTHPDDLERHNAKWLACVASGEPLEDEVRFRRADGEYRWHLQRGVPLRGEAGNIVKWYGVHTDIEDRKRAEEALRSSKAYLAEAQRLSQTGSWAWKAATGEPGYWSEECYRVLGFDPAEPLPLLETFFQRIVPEERAAVREQFDRAIRNKADFELDLRFVHPIKGIRTIRSTGHAVLDRCGDLREIVGTVIDITEGKAAEGKIREQEMELRQILDLTPQLVAVLGLGGERLYANRVALDYFSLSLEEWQQAPEGIFSSHKFIHPDDRERVARGYSDSIRSGGSAFEVEVRVQRADGNYRWFLVRYNPLHDDKGQVKRWYVALTDIDERKRAEEKLQLENVALREEVDKASMFEEIVGKSPALKSVLSHISKVAPNDSTVLITGETGTGKELVARAIHKHSQRSSRAFISVNCAAIPHNLIASELFGHERGAFTGAMQQRLGRFELASGGTIFLDEVGELPAATQIALLRVLQEREFERVGGARPIRADVRVIAATNRDLEADIRAGTFRNDLFYRLNVFPIEIPPLRERREDIPVLVEYFINRYARKAGRHMKGVNKKTLKLLQSYPWPGNIRELQNVIERAVILCETEIFSIDDSWLSRPLLTESTREIELPRRLLAQEKDMIESALKDTRGRVSGPGGAAGKLGIPRSTLEAKIRALKIDKHRFKTHP